MSWNKLVAADYLSLPPSPCHESQKSQKNGSRDSISARNAWIVVTSRKIQLKITTRDTALSRRDSRGRRECHGVVSLDFLSSPFNILFMRNIPWNVPYHLLVIVLYILKPIKNVGLYFRITTDAINLNWHLATWTNSWMERQNSSPEMSRWPIWLGFWLVNSEANAYARPLWATYDLFEPTLASSPIPHGH